MVAALVRSEKSALGMLRTWHCVAFTIRIRCTFFVLDPRLEFDRRASPDLAALLPLVRLRLVDVPQGVSAPHGPLRTLASKA